MVQQHFSTQLVRHIASLANLSVSAATEEKMAHAFAETLEVISNLAELELDTIEPTAQTTGLENVWRDDDVAPEKSLTQTEALANARAVHNGYFVVERVLRDNS